MSSQPPKEKQALTYYTVHFDQRLLDETETEFYNPQEVGKHFAWRRKAIMDLILKAGHPSLLRTSDLALLFGKTQRMIQKDIHVIKPQIVEHLNADMELRTVNFYNAGLEHYAAVKQFDKGAKILKDWNDYLFDFGTQKRAPKKVEFQGSPEVDALHAAYLEVENEREQESAASADR